MYKQLKNNFFQAAFGSLVWVTLLCSFTDLFSQVAFSYFWHLIAISLIIGSVFGILYPYLWSYATLKAPLTILICTVVNTLCGFACVYLYPPQMFELVRPFFFAVLLLTLVLHILMFYFYSKYENRKMAVKLNRLHH